MKKVTTIIVFFLVSKISFAQCFAPTALHATNINYYNAEVSWGSVSGSHHYKIRFKETSSQSGWNYINNIDSSLSSRIISNLTPLTEYAWQIRTYCDSTNTVFSSWSIADTFLTITNNCPNTDSLYTININHNNATANWNAVLGADRYKVRYKVLGSSTWSNLAAIYHPTTIVNIPLLQQNTTYEWQVVTFHDTTILMSSLWSVSDTFTTTSFVAAPFNPLITNTLSTLECNAIADLQLQITQSSNEPDIGSGLITSDGGYFDLNSLAIGDSVGFAIMTTTTQSVSTVLKVGIILGQNYAVINSYDSAGYLIGFFTIENDNVGVKVQLPGSPNDGNNYTSGYISEIYFTGLFVNPQNSGPLHFFIDINSELNDQIYTTDTVQIWCNTTGTVDLVQDKKAVLILDVLGKKTQIKPNIIQIIKLSDGTLEKRVYLKK